MDKNPNILMVVPRLNIGGAETYVTTVATGLADRGYKVVVASWGGNLVKTLLAHNVEHFLVPIRLNATVAGFMLRWIIKNKNIDIIHANSAAAGFAALKASQNLKVPIVYTAHGILSHHKRDLELNKADEIICVSEFLRKVSIEQGFTANRLTTLYNGVDVNKFRPRLEDCNDMRSRLGIGHDEFVVGIVSRIKNSRQKGHNDLLEMFTKFGIPHKWRLLVVGKGMGLPALKRRAKQLGIGDKVCFAGLQHDVPQMMAAMDVVALPSSFETFGLVLVEASAMAKPVVAYAVGGTPEAVDDGHTGFVVPKGDIAGMYQRINELYANKDLALRIGENGMRRVHRMFNSELMLDNIIAVYNKVLARYE